MNDRDFARAHDRWLDPPDEPEIEYRDCDGCGESYQEDQLIRINGQHVCEDCAALEEE